MPPNVWAAYVQNIDQHLAEVTILQAQAATYGATAGMKEARANRQSWMSYLMTAARPRIADASQIGSATWKARLQQSGIAVKEVPK
ncbi:hypothetical protein LCGC14_0577620 [marine sediment metagenome]|uniref:Uncharacterized protein n=1 Tax=marine sediment metagenome TaxID=412755 RepID=A0A0F9RMF8_9ZZZZ